MHLRIGRIGALREDWAGSWGLLAVCRLPACRVLPLPHAIHGHLLGSNGRAGVMRCRWLGGPCWGPLLGWHHRLLGGGQCWSSRRHHSGSKLLVGGQCRSGRR